MRARGWLSLLLLSVLVVSWVGALAGAQEEAPPAAGNGESADQGESAINWDEALFVLLVLFLVMAGMIGFEWVHRRRALL